MTGMLYIMPSKTRELEIHSVGNRFEPGQDYLLFLFMFLLVLCDVSKQSPV